MAAVTPALAAYERLAPYYDAFTAGYGHDRWLGRVEGLVRELGLSGWRLLDVACGTGSSSEPMLRRGWEVTACDLSPGMVARARARLRAQGRVFVADMRRLPRVGPFDLVTCLDDSLNYLLTDEDLGAAFSSMARALRPGGMAVFDCNSLLTYRTTFASEFVRDCDGSVLRWIGEARPDAAPGRIVSASIEVSPGGSGPVESRHVQRHHPRKAIDRALRRAGLQLVAARGQHTGARLVPEASEEACPKLLYVAQKGGDGMSVVVP
jgi:SAM-dependent methyltransferase